MRIGVSLLLLAIAAGEAGAQTPPPQKPVVKTTKTGEKTAEKPKSRPKRPAAPRPGEADGGIAVSVEGDYDGVSAEKAPASQSARRKHRPNTVSWVGFQMAGGAPRVFLQTTSTPTYSQTLAGDDLVVRVPGFTLETRNDARPLETQYFQTDVLEVAAKNAGGGVEVRVRFRKGTARQAQARVSNDLLVLDFGGGSGSGAAAPPESGG